MSLKLIELQLIHELNYLINYSNLISLKEYIFYLSEFFSTYLDVSMSQLFMIWVIWSYSRVFLGSIRNFLCARPGDKNLLPVKLVTPVHGPLPVKLVTPICPPLNLKPTKPRYWNLIPLVIKDPILCLGPVVFRKESRVKRFVRWLRRSVSNYAKGGRDKKSVIKFKKKFWREIKGIFKEYTQKLVGFVKKHIGVMTNYTRKCIKRCTEIIIACIPEYIKTYRPGTDVKKDLIFVSLLLLIYFYILTMHFIT